MKENVTERTDDTQQAGSSPVAGGRDITGQRPRNPMRWDLKARGEPFLWLLGGAQVIGILMIVGFVALILYNGLLTFYPKPLDKITLKNGSVVAGELYRSEAYRPSPESSADLTPDQARALQESGGLAGRRLYRKANFDLYNEDFQWIPDFDIAQVTSPTDLFFFERIEWGPFIGTIENVDLRGKIMKGDSIDLSTLSQAHKNAVKRRSRILDLERNKMGAINHYLEKGRLKLRKVELAHGKDSVEYRRVSEELKAKSVKLEAKYEELAQEAASVKRNDAQYTVTLADSGGRTKTIKLSEIVRFYPANTLAIFEKVRIYLSRWWEFVTKQPREANTEGGVMPAIFGTLCMTVLMALCVAPFGVMAALYLREYAKQGYLVSLVRICVNNLAGVPSIVYGVFGLGFFAYVLGGSIDELLFPERLPNPTFGTGGIMWASLTLALLTVPVVIVATEEALAAVPKSLREGSLACGASKWQTIRRIVLPRAMPGIMTGLILAMARGAGEVAPLMLIGVVKMAPELPVDQYFPYIHLDRSFMHLGFHIFDVAFQSRDSEAAKPMVYVTTLLLISLVFAMNIASIVIRNRLKRKFFTGHF